MRKYFSFESLDNKQLNEVAWVFFMYVLELYWIDWVIYYGKASHTSWDGFRLYFISNLRWIIKIKVYYDNEGYRPP